MKNTYTHTPAERRLQRQVNILKKANVLLKAQADSVQKLFNDCNTAANQLKETNDSLRKGYDNLQAQLKVAHERYHEAEKRSAKAEEKTTKFEGLRYALHSVSYPDNLQYMQGFINALRMQAKGDIAVFYPFDDLFKNIAELEKKYSEI